MTPATNTRKMRRVSSDPTRSDSARAASKARKVWSQGGYVSATVRRAESLAGIRRDLRNAGLM